MKKITNLEELFQTAIEEWKDAKGRGVAFVPTSINDKGMILYILQRIYMKTPDTDTLIIVNTFDKRLELIEFLTNQEDAENNEEFKSLINNKKIKILTNKLVSDMKYLKAPRLLITYHCDSLSDNVLNCLDYCKFILIMIDKLYDNVTSNKIYRYAPLINSFTDDVINSIRASTPVEDIWIPVTIPEDSEEFKLLTYYDEYIRTTINIFGSFDAVQQARIGNASLNISANQICAQIAYDNGWNENLDMSIPINVEVDNMYNPAAIRERANTVFEVIRNRANLLSDYKGKLVEIIKIIEEHPNEKFLIISKRGEFANEITEYINNMSETDICGNYHDKVSPQPTVTFDKVPVYYSSGDKKGVRKMMGAQRQKTLNQQWYNADKLRILSTSNAPDKSLAINVTNIIITSPSCEDIESYLYRLSNVRYPNEKVKLYSIFVKNSLEYAKLKSKLLSNTHKVLNNEEFCNIDENISDFVMVV